MIQATALRKGMAVIYQGEIHIVSDAKHYTPGNKRGFVQVSLKNLRTGSIFQNKFSSTDNIEVAYLVSKTVQYLYNDQHGYHFMDMEDYHTIDMTEDSIGDDKYYLKENCEYEMKFYEDRPIMLNLPSSVELKVVESPPGVKGDSVSSNTKPATLETGLKVQVPLFVDEGTVIKVDTRTGEYISRA